MTAKSSSIWNIEIDVYFLIILFFAALSPFVLYKMSADSYELYSYGSYTSGMVTVESHPVTRTRRGSFGTNNKYTTINFEVKYLGDYRITLSPLNNESQPKRYERINLFYSTKNPKLAIRDIGQNKSFIGLLGELAKSIWLAVAFLIIFPLSWAYVFWSVRKFIREARNINFV